MGKFPSLDGRGLRGGCDKQLVFITSKTPNFRIRLGKNLYNEIFHVLVGIFHQLYMITFKILSHDGTLYPSWARYKGCTHFCEQCAGITVQNVIGKVRNRILYRLNNLSNNNPGEELSRQNLCIQTIRSNVLSINLDDGSIIIQCPKLPKDTDARIGVRRDPKNPDKKQKIFGYNLVLSTSVELHLNIELPVAVTNISGNAEEGSQLIHNKDQIHNHHHCKVIIDIADAKYNTTYNYEYIRGKGSIPIVDYNPRNEDLSKQTLRNRGYDQKGWP